MKITRTSMITGIERTLELDITQDQMDTYNKEHFLLQDAFPHLGAGDREFIKTGITDEEWDKYLSDNPEEE